jgi:hypothetical protein
MNNWVEILQAFKNGKFDKYYYGLTPRFIVGACQVPIGSKFKNGQIAYEVTKQVFDGMKSYNKNGLIVTSNHCEIHNGPVMNLSEGNLSENSIRTEFDEIWARYGDEIIEGNFGISSYDRKILEIIFNNL